MTLLANILLVFVVSQSASSALAAADGFSSCFVPAATASATALRPHPCGPSRIIIPTRLSLASSNLDRKSRKFSRNPTTRIPRHQEEAVGITTSLGLWRTSKRMRQILKEKWNSLRMKRSGMRRRKLASRFKSYFLRDDLSSTSYSQEEDDDQAEGFSLEDDEKDDDSIATSLDAMRARAGVLRTRIRLRQESLSALEKLMGDFRLELRRMQWKNVYNENAGSTKRTVFMYGQNSDRDDAGDNDTDEVMNEFELEAINRKWKEQQIKGSPHQSDSAHTYDNVEGEDDDPLDELQLDRMGQRSSKLQSSILLDTMRLQRLERRILCLENNELGMIERAVGNTLGSLNDLDPVTVIQQRTKRFLNTLGESTSVLLRKLDRVSSREGASNRDYTSLTDFVVQETAAGVRIVRNLLSNPSQLSQLVDPDTPTLVPHVPAILARLDRLESHVSPILSRVLNNKQHLRSIEPYLSEILERLDDIEPHLPWILDHIDTLAPYTGLLLKHIDELLLYAAVDEYEEGGENGRGNYAFAEQLLPYLEVYVSQLDLVGPHLPLLRPHLPMLLKHNRIKILSPHVGVLFSKGYKDLSASANMDILLFYFGWALHIPFVPRIFFSFPGSPRMVSFLANRLPKRLVRGQCCDVSCYVDGDYGKGWNELSK
ncbi:hypothetical protein ACHAW5_001238 [Stephanodiscus triporus]|uniref:Uncharacterized protein n=1 Tax=Stephanodiscus triporus TaxID=2934178 RepID=A0ABD3N032_9STRA